VGFVLSFQTFPEIQFDYSNLKNHKTLLPSFHCFRLL